MTRQEAGVSLEVRPGEGDLTREQHLDLARTDNKAMDGGQCPTATTWKLEKVHTLGVPT